MAPLYGDARKRGFASANKVLAVKHAENRVVPMCEADSDLGPWKAAQILPDHITMELGFSRMAYQAETVSIEVGGLMRRFVHFKKQHTWFVAAVGGPQMRKANMVAVRVIEELNSKVWGCAKGEDVDRSGDQDQDEDVPQVQDDEVIDPMERLCPVMPEDRLETPKKKPRRCKESQRSHVREIEMPMRPPCVQKGQPEWKQVRFYVGRPQSRALWIDIEDIDWLISYAADEHHYQGVARIEDSEQPAQDYEIEWDYDMKRYDCRINVGPQSGLIVQCDVDTVLTKDVYEKLSEAHACYDVFWSQTTVSLRKQACRKYLQLWCEATTQGKQSEFEASWGSPSSAKAEQPAQALEDVETDDVESKVVESKVVESAAAEIGDSVEAIDIGDANAETHASQAAIAPETQTVVAVADNDSA